MRALLRLLMAIIGSPLLLFLCLGVLTIAVLDEKLPMPPAIAAGVALTAISGWAMEWRRRDRTRVDPYVARRQFQKKLPTTRAAGQPIGLAALPVTRATLVLPALSPAPGEGPPEMISRLPAALNRMVVEGLLATAPGQGRAD